MLCGCGEDAPPSKSNSYTPPDFKKNEPATVSPAQPVASQGTTSQTAQPAAATPAKDARSTGQRVGTQIISDAAAVVDYGTGATPLTIKKTQADKLQSIQNQRNQSTQKALTEK